jgi:glycine hydroxymethyltransferase
VKNSQVFATAMIELGFKVISGGTDNHLFLLDLTNMNITGKAAEAVLDLANITVNKNTIPNDPQSPFVTSGLRIGTPAITTRGFKEPEVRLLANWISEILRNPEDAQVVNKVKAQVLELCAKFPVYEW